MKIDYDLLDESIINNKSKKSLIDLFIRKTSVLTSVNESLVDMVVKDQWANANEVTRPTSDIKEIDFPNIGKMYISSSKVRKKIARINNPETKSKKSKELLKREEEFMKTINLKYSDKIKIKTNE